LICNVESRSNKAITTRRIAEIFNKELNNQKTITHELNLQKNTLLEVLRNESIRCRELELENSSLHKETLRLTVQIESMTQEIKVAIKEQASFS